MPTPVAHLHYPTDLAEFVAWFSTDADCRDYLRWLRWPDGFECPECGGPGWLLKNGRYACAVCRNRTSLTAGTLFESTRLSLALWFHGAWLFAANKGGVSASALQRQLNLHSYQTAWTMLTKFRVATAAADRDLLSGDVEVDETLFGGLTQGLRGRAPGAKVLIGIAVERVPGGGFGRCRMAVLDSASGANLRAFIEANVEPGSTIYTDGWQPYVPPLRGRPYQHVPHDRPGCSGGSGPARGPSDRLALQALGAGDPEGQRRLEPRRALPERVRLPVQPPTQPAPRAGLPTLDGALRRALGGVLQGAHAQRRAHEGPSAHTSTRCREGTQCQR